MHRRSKRANARYFLAPPNWVGCLKGRAFRYCPCGWSQYLQRMGPPLRARFFAPQLVQTHCTRAPSGIYSPTVRFSESILRFCRYPLPMSDWSCSRALPEERTVPSRSKVRFSSVSGSSAPAMRYAQALRYARRRMRKTGVASAANMSIPITPDSVFPCENIVTVADAVAAAKMAQISATGGSVFFLATAFAVRYGFVLFVIAHLPPPDRLQTPRRDRRRRAPPGCRRHSLPYSSAAWRTGKTARSPQG